jgi:hypothetical protein
VVSGLPAALLRIEGGAELGAALYFYARGDHSWPLFVVLILAPDLSALGYVLGPKIGSYVYNAVHLELWPLALVAFGFRTDLSMELAI